jgi:serine/threonine protein kinase/CRP-like cAMP-binding protein
MTREVYGKYELLSRIASGGMAEVWLARSSSIGGFEKLLAIKRMHPRFGSSENFISMFIEEAKLSVSLSHPNIVQIFDFGEVSGNYFIAMEYVDGVDLSTLASRSRDRGEKLPVAACAYIIRQVLEGLAYAHKSRKGPVGGIIHRDVSPHNVLVSFDGLVKLSDFGIAKAIKEAGEAAGEVVGKSAYVSPEQARGEPLSAATDLWSVGVITHELLTGVRLFAQGSDAETLAAVHKQPITPPSRDSADIPPELDALTLSLLERSAEKRPASARNAVETLSEILRTHWPKYDGYALSEQMTALFEGAEEGADSSHTAGLENTAPGTGTVSRHKSITPIRAPTAPPEVRSIPLQTGLRFSESPPPNETAEQKIVRLKNRFKADPNLWTLFDIGVAYEDARQPARATAAFKVAAAKFAQAGLLVQALTIVAKMSALTGMNTRLRDFVRRLPELGHLSSADLLYEIFDSEESAVDIAEYQALFGDITERSREDSELLYSAAPVFSSLNIDQLVHLVKALQLRRFPPGSRIVSEGGTGTSFFWIGRGRVVVSTTSFDGRRVFLTSLADGDCFGEQAFFTGEPRSATVEATDDVLILEASREALEPVVREFPAVEESLLHFYQSRVVESLLARSKLFGHLSVRERRMLAQHFTFVNHPKHSVILREGDHSDALYAIKTGRIEVFTGGAGVETRLAELGPGQVFGEIAAVKGLPRTASVRAIQDCELIRLEAKTLQQFLAHNAETRAVIEHEIETRAEETITKLMS